MKETIAITGVTGHLGFNLVKFLLQEGYQVRALIRSNQVPFIKDDLLWVHGDLTNVDNLNTLLHHSDTLIHCASLVSLDDLDKKNVYQTNVVGTKTLIDLCVKNKIRMIHISSSSVGQTARRNEKFDESNPYIDDQNFYYAWTKAKSEKMVLSSVKNENLDAFIVRPTAIIGPADPKPSPFGQTIFDIHLGKLSILTSGGYDLVDVRDLCKTIIKSLTMGKKGEVYLIGGEYISIKKLARLLKPKGFQLIIPVDFLLFLLPLIKIYDRIFGLKWPITRESLYTLKHAPKHVNSSKAKQELLHVNRPIKTTLDDLIEWFNQKNIAL